MKFVFLNRYFHPDHSATSQILTDLAIALGRTHEVVVVTSRQRYDEPRVSLPRRDWVDRVNVRRVWTTRFGRDFLPGRALDYLSFHFSAGIALLRIAARGDAVVAMTDPPLVSVVAAVVCALKGTRLVNWLQDLFPEVAEALGTRWLRGPAASCLRGLRNGSLRAAEANVVLSEAMAARVEALGVPGKSVRIIPNWANGAQIRPIDAASSRMRRDCGLRQPFVVAYSGNMGRAHEFDTILRAAALIQAQDRQSNAPAEVRKRTVFLFIGGGAQRGSIESRGRELGITGLVFKPYQPRESLCDSLGAADVHLVSLRPELEGLIVPSKLYGILAAGRPVVFIGAEDGEIAQLVRRERVGFAVRPGKDDELAGILTGLRNDNSLRAEMGARARRVFEERFDFPIAAGKFEEVLDPRARFIEQPP